MTCLFALPSVSGARRLRPRDGTRLVGEKPQAHRQHQPGPACRPCTSRRRSGTALRSGPSASVRHEAPHRPARATRDSTHLPAGDRSGRPCCPRHPARERRTGGRDSPGRSPANTGSRSPSASPPPTPNTARPRSCRTTMMSTSRRPPPAAAPVPPGPPSPHAPESRGTLPPSPGTSGLHAGYRSAGPAPACP